MARNTRLPAVKTAVMVKDLIVAIERVRDAELKKNAEKVAAYKTRRTEYVKTIRTHLKARVLEIGPDFTVPRMKGWGRDLGTWLCDGLPEEPEHPGDAKCISQKYDVLIAQLRISAEPKVRLSPEDYAKFMTGDASACVC